MPPSVTELAQFKGKEAGELVVCGMLNISAKAANDIAGAAALSAVYQQIGTDVYEANEAEILETTFTAMFNTIMLKCPKRMEQLRIETNNFTDK